jgi:hypothetical protein
VQTYVFSGNGTRTGTHRRAAPSMRGVEALATASSSPYRDKVLLDTMD